jgi:replication fork clamp-binding protein CrfC
VPANQDISTSDGLQLAKQIDPEGRRTIGVITKIDIMDKGTDAKRLLLGEDIYLKLGWVGIVNRSQQDINQELRVRNAIENEQK